MASLLNDVAPTTWTASEAVVASDNVVLLRALDVARLLGLSRSQTYQMMADGRLPVVRIGRAVRVPKQALAEWIRSNTAKSGNEVASHEA